MRIAAAILVDTLAFIIWNLASRSPARMVRDLVNGLRRPATFVRGLVSFGVGLLLLIGSMSLLVPLTLPHNVFLIMITWTLLTGLLVEQVIGPEIYARWLEPRGR